MAQRPQCQEDGAVVHKGFDKTNKTWVDPKRPDVTWEIWKCQCGKKQLEVIPGTKRSW